MTENDVNGTVPSWNGDLADWEAYTLRVRLYVRGTEKERRAVCAARLMGKLTGRAWNACLQYPYEETLESVKEDATTKLPEGVAALLKHLRESSGILEVEDAGNHMRRYMKQQQRPPRNPMKDYIASFELNETRLQQAI